MSKIDEARMFLQLIGMPGAQQTDLCCYVILAMAGLRQDMLWNEATNEWLRIHDIIQFVNKYYGCTYAENSRETFRKQALHRFRTAALVEDNGVATNSPNYRYRLTNEALQTIRSFGTSKWQEYSENFLKYHEKLVDIYASKKKMTMLPVKINGLDFNFSTGKHNELQKAIIEEFAPRFAPNSECLYVGDTIEKDLVKNKEKLSNIGKKVEEQLIQVGINTADELIETGAKDAWLKIQTIDESGKNDLRVCAWIRKEACCKKLVVKSMLRGE